MATEDAPQRSSGSSAGKTSQQAAFVSILNNQQKAARVGSGRPARTRGFAVLVRNTDSLQVVQQWCIEQTWNPECITLRYRIESGSVLGTLLAAALCDLNELRRDAATLSGRLQVRTASRNGQPALVSDPGRINELADSIKGTRGELSSELVADVLDELNRTAAYDIGHRLVLLAEVTGNPDDNEASPGSSAPASAEWHRTAALFDLLPERMGIVIAGAPESFSLPRAPHTLELDLTGVEARPVEADVYEPGKLSSDRPTEHDQLGVRRYAQALAQFVMHPETRPLTIAIQGPWGKGKSSFMLLVRRSLLDIASVGGPSGRRSGGVVPVWFNAWSFQDASQVWAGLAQECTKEIEAALPRWRRIVTPLAYAWRKRRAELVFDVILPVIVAGLVLALAAVGVPALESWLEKKLASDELARLLGSVLPWGASFIAAFWIVASRAQRVIGPLSKRVWAYFQRPDYATRIGEQNQVRKEIEDLVKQLYRGRPRARIVVFIDDLDRCSNDHVMEILQATNLILGESECYVVFGIDAAMIHRAIEAHFGTAERPLEPRFAEHYLAKIIQLPFNIPDASREQRADFVASLFSEAARRDASKALIKDAEPTRATTPSLAWDRQHLKSAPERHVPRPVPDTGTEVEAFLEFQARLDDNPRELKRLVNVHRFVKIVLAKEGRPATDDVQRKLVVWLMFCARWPDLCSDVLSHAHANPNCEDCIAEALDTNNEDASDFAGDLKLTGTELARDGTLALAASISQSVRWRSSSDGQSGERDNQRMDARTHVAWPLHGDAVRLTMWPGG
jgi:hypothetical protein